MSDPTPSPDQAPQPGHPWLPPSMKPWKERRPLTYVVIDEIESDFVGLSVAPWPTVDEVGRLRFGPGRPRSVGAARADLTRFVARHRLPRSGSRRPLRIGDAFAVAVKEPVPAGEVADPAAWIEPPVYDISPDARDAAKASFYSAVAPTLDPEARTDARILELAGERKSTQAAPSRSRRAPAARRGRASGSER